MKYILILCIAFMSALPIKAAAVEIDQAVLRSIILYMESSKYRIKTDENRVPSYYNNKDDIPYKMQGYDDGNILIIHVPVPNSGGLTVPKFIFVDEKK